MLALSVHRETNGDEACQVLLARREKDITEKDRAYAEILEENRVGLNRRRWQLPIQTSSSSSRPAGNPAFQCRQDSPRPTVGSSAALTARQNIEKGNPSGSLRVGVVPLIAKQPKIEKTKQLFAAKNYLRLTKRLTDLNQSTSASLGVSGPSTSGLLNPLPTCIAKKTVVLPTKRLSPEDFYITSLNSYVDLSKPEGDWKFVVIEPNLESVFVTIRKHFFRYVPGVSTFSAIWSDTIADQTNFTINLTNRTADFNRKTLVHCPRGNLVSVIFHALIHISVHITSKASGRRIDKHDMNFREIMKHFNEKLDLGIGTDHRFIRATDELEDYQCQRCCELPQLSPFLGVVKCPVNQSIPKIVIEKHKNCDGIFHKVFKVTRQLNNNIENRHIVHKKFNNPNVAQQGDGHHQTNIQPREIVDITEDDETATRVVQLTQVIDLQDDEFDVRSERVRKVVELIKTQVQVSLKTCLFCQSKLDLYGGFRRHLDLCLGQNI